MSDQKNNFSHATEGEQKAAPNEAVDNSDANVEAAPTSADVSADAAEKGDELEAAQQEIAKLKDAFLRAKAEEDNVRRRSEKEIANGRKFAVEGFAKEMMNVYDSLKLACSVEIAEDADDTIKSIHDGVELTFKQLGAAFARFSVEEIVPAIGEKPDPNLHQAMSIVESAEIASGCIVTVIQPGFKLHDRLLRPAMVIVAT